MSDERDTAAHGGRNDAASLPPDDDGVRDASGPPPADDAFASRSEPAAKQKKSRPFWQEVIILFVVAVLIAWFVKAFFIQSFYVPSESMMPTLVGHSVGAKPDDRLLVQKVSYWSGGPERGDVVVFKDPGGWLADAHTPDPNVLQRGMEIIGLYPTGDHLVKRVIGVGGDRIECCDSDGRLTINGEPIDEPYVKNPAATADREFKVTIPEGKLWVMGDNRAQSEDSRFHLGDDTRGFVDEDLVVGKVWTVVWPFDRFGGLPDTGEIAELD